MTCPLGQIRINLHTCFRPRTHIDQPINDLLAGKFFNIAHRNSFLTCSAHLLHQAHDLRGDWRLIRNAILQLVRLLEALCSQYAYFHQMLMTITNNARFEQII